MEANASLPLDHLGISPASSRTAPYAATEPSATPAEMGLSVEVVDFLSGYKIAGILENFTPGETTILVEESIPEFRTVTVQFQSFVFEGETLFCGARGREFELHITIDDAEKSGLRKSPRFPLRMQGEIFLKQAPPAPVTIVDISAGGMGLELPIAVQAGQPIAISTGRVFVFGVVAHCRRGPDGGFRAGVEMKHVLERNAEAGKTEERSLPGLFAKVLRKRALLGRKR